MPAVAAVEKARFTYGTLAAVSSQLQEQIAVALAPVFMAKWLLAVPEVESVHVLRDHDTFRVWTVIDSDEDPAYDAIYAKEKKIINEMKPFLFDFHVLARRGRQLESFITLDSVMTWHR
jgi:hypothetical protein